MAALLESHTGLQLQIEASNERNVDQSGADHGSGGVFPIRDNVDVGERLGHWDARLSLAYVFSDGQVQKAVDAVEKQRVDEEDVVEGEELVEEDEEGEEATMNSQRVSVLVVCCISSVSDRKRIDSCRLKRLFHGCSNRTPLRHRILF